MERVRSRDEIAARARVLAAALALEAMATGCASEPLPPPARPRPRPVASAAPTAQWEGPPGLPAGLAGRGEPFGRGAGLAVRATGAMTVTIEGEWLVGRVWSREAAPIAEVELGASQGLVDAPVVKARGEGWVVLVDRVVDENHLVEIYQLGADGRSTAPALALPPIAEAGVSFVDLALFETGALVLVERRDDERVGLSVQPLAAGLDRTTGPLRPVFEGALAWSAGQREEGVAVGLVREDVTGREGPRRGRIEALTIDRTGAVSSPVSIPSSAGVEIDLEVATLAEGTLLAWTEGGATEGAVRIAALDREGKLVSPPKLVEPPIGDQALVRLVADPRGRGARALVAWENLGVRAGDARVVQLATASATGALDEPRARVLVETDERPDFAAYAGGFLGLTLAEATAEGTTSKGPLPTLVRLDEGLSVRGAEAVRFAGARSADGIPAAAFGLACDGPTCFLLASDDGAPAPLFVVGATERVSPWRAPAWRVEDDPRPRVTSLRTLTEGAPLSAAAATKLGGSGGATLATWVTYFLDGDTPSDAAPKGEPPYAATLGLTIAGSDGAVGEPVVLSRRALSPGGVAVATPPQAKRPEAVVAWVASDRGAPQVFATKVDGQGKKLAQRKITVTARDAKGSKRAAPASPAETTGDAVASFASSVSIAWSGAPAARRDGDSSATDGYVLAWVDTRDGNPELYVARMNHNLEKTIVDRRITNDPGDTAETSLAMRGAEAFVAYTDAPGGKASDVFVARLDAATLRPLEPPARLYASAGRSRAPRLVLAGDRLLATWIEEPEPGTNGPSTLRLAELDPTGKLRGAPAIVSAPDGAAILGHAVACGQDGLTSCRLVVAWSSGAAPELGGFSLDGAGKPGPIARLGPLASSPLAEPSLVFADASARELFFVEDAAGRGGRLRAVGLGW